MPTLLRCLTVALLALASGCLASNRAASQFGLVPPSAKVKPQIPVRPAPCLPVLSRESFPVRLTGGNDEGIGTINVSLDKPPEPWPITLDEAIAVAIQNSNVVRTLTGTEVGPDARTIYDPAVAEQRTRMALASFDTSFDAGFFWNRINAPPDAFFGQGIPVGNRRDVGYFNSGLSTRWFSGATTRLAYNPTPTYLFFPGGTSSFNPAYVANLELSIRQPLLQGAGKEVNTAPIVVEQVKREQSKWEFKGALLEMVRSIEEAYWNLVAARRVVEVVEVQLKWNEEVVRLEQALFDANRAIAADVAKARALHNALQQRVIEAKAAVRKQELLLRNLMLVPSDDGRMMIPATKPLTAMVAFDLQATVDFTLRNQPTILERRLEVQLREIEVMLAQNGLRPRFDLYALMRTNGLNNDLGRSLGMMFDSPYQDWEFGTTYSVTLGRYEAKARLQASELQLARTRELLRQQVQSQARAVYTALVQIRSLHEQYSAAEIRARQTHIWLDGAKVRYENPPPAGDNNWLVLALDDYLRALRAVEDAETDVAVLLARYNTQLARLRELEGALLDTSNIQLVDDPCRGILVDKLPAVPVKLDLPEEPALPGQEGKPPPEIIQPNPLETPAAQPAAPPEIYPETLPEIIQQPAEAPPTAAPQQPAPEPHNPGEIKRIPPIEQEELPPDGLQEE